MPAPEALLYRRMSLVFSLSENGLEFLRFRPLCASEYVRWSRSGIEQGCFDVLLAWSPPHIEGETIRSSLFFEFSVNPFLFPSAGRWWFGRHDQNFGFVPNVYIASFVSSGKSSFLKPNPFAFNILDYLGDLVRQEICQSTSPYFRVSAVIGSWLFHSSFAGISNFPSRVFSEPMKDAWLYLSWR